MDRQAQCHGSWWCGDGTMLLLLLLLPPLLPLLLPPLLPLLLPPLLLLLLLPLPPLLLPLHSFIIHHHTHVAAAGGKLIEF